MLVRNVCYCLLHCNLYRNVLIDEYNKKKNYLHTNGKKPNKKKYTERIGKRNDSNLQNMQIPVATYLVE